MDALLNWRMSLPEGERSLRAAAKKLGVSHAHLIRWERGRRRIAAERVPQVERITGIPAHVLRPDIFVQTARRK